MCLHPPQSGKCRTGSDDTAASAPPAAPPGAFPSISALADGGPATPANPAADQTTAWNPRSPTARRKEGPDSLVVPCAFLCCVASVDSTYHVSQCGLFYVYCCCAAEAQTAGSARLQICP